jgi:glutamine synthetase
MVGSSQDIATPNTYLNTAVAEVLGEFADRLEKAANKNEEIKAIVKESYTKHKKVVFNGNGYSDEWVDEAAKRGLPNVRSSVEALKVLVEPEIVALFEKHKIFTKEESESRYHIYLENYSKQINIEAGVCVDMAQKGVFPASTDYAASLARDAASLAAINAISSPQEKRSRKLAELCGELFDATAKLETVLADAQKVEEPFAQAKAYSDKVRPAMEAARAAADSLEKLVAKDKWPYPGYGEMLFNL